MQRACVQWIAAWADHRFVQRPVCRFVVVSRASRSISRSWYNPSFGVNFLCMLAYQQGDSELTLAQGLREYYTSRDGLVDGRGLSAQAREFFRCHDAAHVVFGCSTDLLDEARVKVWSLFGTTEGLALLHGYRLPESQEIYEELALVEVMRVVIQSFVAVPRVFIACRRMRRPWPWSEFSQFSDVRLCDLRAEFGIHLAR